MKCLILGWNNFSSSGSEQSLGSVGRTDCDRVPRGPAGDI